MTICIPTTSPDGTAAHMSTHFGEAPYYTLVDPEAASAQSFPNLWARGEEICAGAEGIAGRAVDAVICRGIGPLALEQLWARGIAVLTTDAWTVAEAIRAFRVAKVSRVTHTSAPLG